MLNIKKNENIGFHITSNSIHAVTLEKYQSKIAVLDAASVEFEKQDDLALAFEKIRNQLPTIVQHCTIGLSLADVMIKEVTIATDLSTREILEFMNTHSKEFFGTSHENLMMDYEVLTNDKNNKILRCVAVNKILVNLLLKIIKKIRFHLKAITVDILAIEHLLPWISHYSVDKSQGLLVNQQNQIIMAVIEKNILRHIRWGYTRETLQRYFQLHNVMVEQWFYLGNCPELLSIPILPLELKQSIKNVEKINPDNLCAFAIACEGWL